MSLMSAGPGDLTESARPGVAPRTELERQLAGIWSDVLGVERVGIHDDFFELGGSSARSVELVALAAEAGLDFTLGDILGGATVAQLADAIAVENRPASVPHGGQPAFEHEIRSVALRPGNTQNTVFVLLPALYDLHKVRALSGRLPDASFHVLVPAWSPERPYAGIPALGSAIAEMITSLQPQAPCRIIGHCGAGLAAYHAASLLRARGAPVRLLALLDTSHPRAHGSRRRLAGMLPIEDLGRLDLRPVIAKLDRLEEFRAARDTGRPELMLHLWAVIRSNVSALLRFVVDLDPSRWNEELLDHVARDLMSGLHYCMAAESYVLAPFDGKIDLVYSRPDDGCETEDGRTALTLSWEHAATGGVKLSLATDIHTDILQSRNVVGLLAGSFDAD